MQDALRGLNCVGLCGLSQASSPTELDPLANGTTRSAFTTPGRTWVEDLPSSSKLSGLLSYVALHPESRWFHLFRLVGRLSDAAGQCRVMPCNACRRVCRWCLAMLAIGFVGGALQRVP
eukprot:268984-Pelagomonas_calceolata.AAC.4